MNKSKNICIFSNTAKVYQDLICSQFIYETHPEYLGDNRSYTAFCCHLVTEGEAILHTPFGSWSLKSGDIFFVFPCITFTLEQKSSFKYLYISFVGKHTLHLLESLGITRTTPVRQAFSNLHTIWTEAFCQCNPENLAFMAKSILYYTFALFIPSSISLTGDTEDTESIIILIRDTVEQDYANPDLSLNYLSSFHHYNTSYVSRKFTESMGVSFSEYRDSSPQTT